MPNKWLGVSLWSYFMDMYEYLTFYWLWPHSSTLAFLDILFKFWPFSQFRVKRESEELKAWDRFKTLPPPDEDETLDGEWIEVFIKWLKIFAYLFTFMVTLGSAVLSKSIILLMTSMIRVNRTITVCNSKIFPITPPLEPDKRYAAIYQDNDPERIAWLWVLFFAVIAPDLFVLGRSARICYFKIYHIPSLKTFFTV